MQTPAYLDRVELSIPSAVVTLKRRVEPEPVPILSVSPPMARHRASELADTFGLVAMALVVPALWLAVVSAWVLASS